MLFNSLEYAILLSLSFLAYYSMARWRLLRLLVLLMASYEFYAWWNPTYLLLMIGTSSLDFTMGALIHRSTSQKMRKVYLAISLCGSLGLLATFKYFNFFVHTASLLATRLGFSPLSLHLDVLVPVGISFYTFQSMSYTIDIYRQNLKPAENLLDFFVFVAFFPQLVAGPIVRAAEFLPQLKPFPELSPQNGSMGFYWIGVGLIKKVLIADLLAVNLVDRIFETPVQYTSMELLFGVYGYALQIYCDFSAYSDIAIGSALLLGFKLPQNFNAPYLSKNLQEFWHRWHISLSTWLRDYLFFSLGGSQGGTYKTARNLCLTMLLGGLWHGAAWTFVTWGALHGLGLGLTFAYQRTKRQWTVQPSSRSSSGKWFFRGLVILLTFHFVCLGWIFFRAENFHKAWQILEGLACFSSGTANISPMLWGLLAGGAATHLVPNSITEKLQKLVVRLPAFLVAVLFVLLIIGLEYAKTTEVVPFIYFQF